MTLTGASERLPCGTELAALIAQVADGVRVADPAHQAACPHCQAALGRIRALWSNVRDLAELPVRAPRGLLEEVRARMGRPSAGVMLPDATRGHTQVSERVLVGVAREAAQGVPGVAFASVLAHAAGPGSVVLRVRLVAAYGPSLPVLAASARERIVAHVGRLAGVRVTEVEVSVDDIAR